MMIPAFILLNTYAYNDAAYMAEWGKAIKAAYPQFTFFGETWVQGIPNQVYFTQDNTVNRGFDTQLPGVTDFQTYWAIIEAINGKFGWTDGVTKLYTTLASDYQYQDPTRNVVFLDNHDLSRFYSLVNEDITKYKSAIAWLLTTRRIPHFYYGAEILMKNLANPDGKVREDCKDGWAGDKINKFTASGRTPQENEIFNYVRTLANYRKQNEVLQTGKITQYVPENGVYVYSRYNNAKTIMVAMNTSGREEALSLNRFNERIQHFTQGQNILTNEIISIKNNLKIPAKATLILEL